MIRAVRSGKCFFRPCYLVLQVDSDSGHTSAASSAYLLWFTEWSSWLVSSPAFHYCFCLCETEKRLRGLQLRLTTANKSTSKYSIYQHKAISSLCSANGYLTNHQTVRSGQRNAFLTEMRAGRKRAGFYWDQMSSLGISTLLLAPLILSVRPKISVAQVNTHCPCC